MGYKTRSSWVNIIYNLDDGIDRFLFEWFAMVMDASLVVQEASKMLNVTIAGGEGGANTVEGSCSDGIKSGVDAELVCF